MRAAPLVNTSGLMPLGLEFDASTGDIEEITAVVV
jgi:hypothetical protein